MEPYSFCYNRGQYNDRLCVSPCRFHTWTMEPFLKIAKLHGKAHSGLPQSCVILHDMKDYISPTVILHLTNNYHSNYRDILLTLESCKNNICQDELVLRCSSKGKI